jgi:hypothetical protein
MEYTYKSYKNSSCVPNKVKKSDKLEMLPDYDVPKNMCYIIGSQSLRDDVCKVGASTQSLKGLKARYSTAYGNVTILYYLEMDCPPFQLENEFKKMFADKKVYEKNELFYKTFINEYIDFFEKHKNDKLKNIIKEIAKTEIEKVIRDEIENIAQNSANTIAEKITEKITKEFSDVPTKKMKIIKKSQEDIINEFKEKQAQLLTFSFKEKQFFCVYCKFKTDIPQIFFNHALTDKHKTNVKGKHMCEFCGKEFNNKQGKYKHKKICKYRAKLK